MHTSVRNTLDLLRRVKTPLALVQRRKNVFQRFRISQTLYGSQDISDYYPKFDLRSGGGQLRHTVTTRVSWLRQITRRDVVKTL